MKRQEKITGKATREAELTHNEGLRAAAVGIDEERLAYHEAAHAVVMWKLGYGIDIVTIEHQEGVWGHTTPARAYDLARAHDPWNRRHMVEQNAMVLHAGSVAEQLLSPGSEQRFTVNDHEQLHRDMFHSEEDGSIQMTWCNYLWQRSYALLAWPAHWKLVVALARVLRNCRTLDGRSTEHYLKRVDDVLRHDPSMPNAKVIGEVTPVSSPWHRSWYTASLEAVVLPKSTTLPQGVTKLTPTPDLRPLQWVVKPLSTRARKCLDRANINCVMDLAYWSARALASIRGAGRLTVLEIVNAAIRAGVQIAPDDAPHPWTVDPGRWRCG